MEKSEDIKSVNVQCKLRIGTNWVLRLCKVGIFILSADSRIEIPINSRITQGFDKVQALRKVGIGWKN